jgi:hypothetical protein
MSRVPRGSAAILATLAALALVALGSAASFGPWSAAQKLDTIGANSAELNTPAIDGCPSQSPDGLRLYLASNRPGGKGGLDIWMATRASASAPWCAPQNLGEPVNSAADDFCPTPVGKKGLFFVSREASPGACGQGDIYFTHESTAGTWVEPERLLCAPAGPNSALDEQGPSWVNASDTLRGKKLAQEVNALFNNNRDDFAPRSAMILRDLLDEAGIEATGAVEPPPERPTLF